MEISSRPEIMNVNAYGDRLIKELDRVFANLKEEDLVVVVIPGRGDAYGKRDSQAGVEPRVAKSPASWRANSQDLFLMDFLNGHRVH